MDCFDKKQQSKKFPRPKKKGLDDSFRYPQGFKINGNNIYLPKLGWFKFRQSKKIMGLPKNVTISYKSGYWYISIQTELSISEPVHPATSMVGIDVGIARFATLSTGGYFKSRNYTRQLEKKLAREQQALARKVKFSNNWNKQKQKIQKLHCRIANSRRDYIHWCSHQISKNHAIIVMEDLKVANMSKSAKGSVEKPGKCVAAKSGLNKSILDQGWSEFRRQLEYKQRWLGGEVLLVNPRNTSRTCPVVNCQHISSNNRKSQSEFECEKCGYINNADIVGAMNVLRAGHAQLACGDMESGSSSAQEPLKCVA
jgi:putative transposase